MRSKVLGSGRGVLGVAILAIVPLVVVTLRGQAKPPYSTWSDYGGAADSMQYSSLEQIDKSNVAQLELAWFHPVPDRKGNFGFNPLVVDKVMYVLGANSSIVALEATTGKLIWTHTPDGGSPGNRGINYWENRDRSDRRLILRRRRDAACDRRVDGRADRELWRQRPREHA